MLPPFSLPRAAGATLALACGASLALASSGKYDETTRFATYNSFLNRAQPGELIADLSTGDDAQARAVAEIIQRTRPDVLLLNEFDFDECGTALQLFQQNYLSVSQNGAQPIHYPFTFQAPSNTGIPSGFDLDNDGSIGTTVGTAAYANDGFGFGFFPGQFGMALLSRDKILQQGVRTFREFRWKDMPGALLPDDPLTMAPGDFYSPAELELFRLSSKSHWDVPILTDAGLVHVLTAHPTPPVFDGPEDRNGRRNHDEIRFWADYVRPWKSGYIVDDEGKQGGLHIASRFVILGDYNADPFDGDGIEGAIQQMLDLPQVQDPCPSSLGGLEAALRQDGVNVTQAGHPALDTADFTDVSPFFVPAGNLRADYVLPSVKLSIADAGVFWPAEDEPFFDLVGPGDPTNGNVVVSSDHRLVWVDVGKKKPHGEGCDVDIEGLSFLGEAILPTGTAFDDTTVGGLSALVYDEDVDLYLALSDDRSQIDPARFYTLTIDLDDGFLDQGDVELREVVTLLDASGVTFASGSIDPEGLALSKVGKLFLASEGDANAGIDPFVDRFGVAGSQIESLGVPAKFLVAPGSGVRNNLAFESLCMTTDQERVLTATENALLQDGPAASLTTGSPCRILVLEPETGEPGAEYVYWTEKVAAPAIPPDQFSTNGLVELLALGKGELLAMERSFSVGVGNTIRLFLVETKHADDVRSIQSLAGVIENVEPVEKSLLLDLSMLGIPLDNVEGMTFGPVLPDGRPTLVLVSDNNFSPSQFTQFLAFAIELDD